GAAGRAGRPLGHGARRARAADAGRSRSIAFGDAARTPGRALSISPAGPGPPDAAALALLPPPADRPWLADPQAGHRRRLGGPGLGRREPCGCLRDPGAHPRRYGGPRAARRPGVSRRAAEPALSRTDGDVRGRVPRPAATGVRSVRTL